MKISKEEWQSMMGTRDQKDMQNLVNHPEHYNQGKYEVIDVIEDWKLDFHCGNAIKYIARHKFKSSASQDIEKAIWYLQRYLEGMNE